MNQLEGEALVPKIDRIAEGEAQRLLAPYHDAIYECFAKAWRIYVSAFKPHLGSPLGRDRRNAMSMLLNEQFRSVLGSVDGIVVREPNERVVAYVEDQVLLHHKFLDDRFQTKNNHTPTSIAFDGGDAIIGIPDYPRILAGYQVDRLETNISGVFLMSRVDGWSYRIDRPETKAVVLPFPEKRNGSKRRIKAKKPKQESAESEDE